MLESHALQGKEAIVTGGGSRMGLAIAEKFAELGAKVVVTSRDLEKCEKAVRKIEAHGGEAIAVACDVRIPEQID